MRKTSTIKSLCLAVAFVFAGFAANAQLTHLEQSVFLNFNAPMAQFNDGIDGKVLAADNSQIPLTSYNVGKGASMGLGLGYRISYLFDVGFGVVSPYIHIDFMWNRTKNEYRDKFIDADGTAPAYFNLSIYVGVNYRYQLNDIFTPFGEFGFGPDFLFISKESGTMYFKDDKGNQTKDPMNFTFRYKSSTNLAWQIGAGTYLGQHVSASLHYSGYGKHKIINKSDNESAYLASDKQNDNTTQSRNIGLLSLRIGFHF